MWTPGEFLVADGWSDEGFHTRAGYVYRGLGLCMVVKGSPKGRRPPTWSLTHIGSGHRVCMIDGKVADAFPIATEIAECGDWSFDGLRGWINVDHDLPAKFADIMARHPKRIRRGGGGRSSEDAARAIAIARA